MASVAQPVSSGFPAIKLFPVEPLNERGYCSPPSALSPIQPQPIKRTHSKGILWTRHVRDVFPSQGSFVAGGHKVKGSEMTIKGSEMTNGIFSSFSQVGPHCVGGCSPMPYLQSLRYPQPRHHCLRSQPRRHSGLLDVLFWPVLQIFLHTTHRPQHLFQQPLRFLDCPIPST